MTEYVFEGAKRASTTITWSFADQTYAPDARYPYTQPIGLSYQDTIRAAFNRWSSVSALTFAEVADSPATQIRVGFGLFTNPLVIGETAFLYGAGVLRPDTVLRLLDPSKTPLVTDAAGGWVYARTGVTLYQDGLHEIGHALGLGHTTDPNTTMYPVLTPTNADLALGDIQGINTLYPLFTVAALDPAQAEGNSGSTSYHFAITRLGDPAPALTLRYSVSGAAYPGLVGTVAAVASEFVGSAYPSGQISFAAGAATTTLTVTIAANALAQPDQGFAIALSSASPGQSITANGSVNAVILDDDGYGSINGNTVGIYRFFEKADGTHFFTASEQERNALILTRPDLVYEGPALSAVANPSADPSATAIFRFFDTRSGTHFYTASAPERDAAVATRPDLVFEGARFYEHAAAQNGDAPVYRFFDTQQGTHFYTSSAAERAIILATRIDLADEGVAFYAPSAT